MPNAANKLSRIPMVSREVFTIILKSSCLNVNMTQRRLNVFFIKQNHVSIASQIQRLIVTKSSVKPG